MASAHRYLSNAVAAIKSSDRVQMSSGTLDARIYASPATDVSVRALRKLRVHVSESVRRYTLMQSDSEGKAPCLHLSV